MRPLDEWKAAQEYALKEHRAAETQVMRAYWQGVKDGLRKCLASFANAPESEVLSWPRGIGDDPDPRPIQ